MIISRCCPVSTQHLFLFLLEFSTVSLVHTQSGVVSHFLLILLIQVCLICIFDFTNFWVGYMAKHNFFSRLLIYLVLVFLHKFDILLLDCFEWSSDIDSHPFVTVSPRRAGYCLPHFVHFLKVKRSTHLSSFKGPHL